MASTPQEQMEFLLNNYGGLTYVELAKAFNVRFGTNTSVSTIISRLYRAGVRKDAFYFSREETAWLKTVEVKNLAALTEDFNRIFRQGKPQKDKKAIAGKLWKIGRKLDICHIYTEEEDLWLRGYFGVMPTTCVTEMFNQKFGTNIGFYGIKQHCTKRLGMKHLVRTWGVKHGGTCPRELMVGAERECDGDVYVKVKKTPPSVLHKKVSIKNSQCWKAKKILAWEEANGRKLPKGKMVMFKNGDRHDFSKKNLVLVSKEELFEISKRGWHREPLLVDVGLAYVRLEKAMKGCYEQTEDL